MNKVIPTTPQSYSLFHEGSIAFAQIEANGMRIDVKKLNENIEKVSKKIALIEEEIKEDEIYKEWFKVYGEKTNLDSTDQTAHILYDVLGLPCLHRTGKGKAKVDKEAMAEIDLPFVKKHLELSKIRTVRDTFLYGIKKELVGEYIHPFFNLTGGSGGNEEAGGARSYRGSSDSPNANNLPGRDSESAELVRGVIIPDEDCHIGECDFKSLEVVISAIVNKDPVLAEYLKDQSKDMHRDEAMNLYMLNKSEVSKNTRYVAKNCFVFPEFYGSVWFQCAKNLWNQIARMGLRVAIPGEKEKSGSGISLKRHLRKKGITELGSLDPKGKPVSGTFAAHVFKEEDRFWNIQYQVYTEWKKQWWKDYLKNGAFNLPTGFRIEGIYSKNQVLNYPIQGSAFHCLLWAIIQLTKWLNKKKLKSKIICQVHDSMVLCLHKLEVWDVLTKVKEIVTKDLPAAWKWLSLPLTIEQELAPLSASWYKKEEIHI